MRLSKTVVRNRRLVAPVLRGIVRGGIRRGPELRHHVLRDAWTVAKRFGAEAVVNIEKREIPCVQEAVVEGYIDDHQRLMLAALARGLHCRSFFEIGTNRGRTAWTVARNNPQLQVYTLDVPAQAEISSMALGLDTDDLNAFRPGEVCGEAFRGTPEAERITQLLGDSATFDFSAHVGGVDFVYVDGAHTYDYVRTDTHNALQMLSPTGTIAWDDYGSNPDVYSLVNELAPSLDRPVYHVFGTRMALYSRQDFVVRRPYDDHSSLPTV
ncbi:MAG TPA: class I SAM-dependent methyltransferase [Solirubrobacteraceae bacterium]|nr:class I SAM-dependent methyltransferase [Solirubrobacteraceae bacterium]